MSHFDFVRPSGQWPPVAVPGASDYHRWDVKQSKSINGDDGGSWFPGAVPKPWLPLTTYAFNDLVIPTPENGFLYWAAPGTSGATQPVFPTTIGGTVVDGGVAWTCAGPRSKVAGGPIIIGGQNDIGLQTGGTTISGGMRTQTGGSVLLSANDFPALSPARTRTVTFDLLTAANAFVAPPPLTGVFMSNAAQPAVQIPSRYLHHGSTAKIAAVTLWYRLLARPPFVNPIPAAGSHFPIFGPTGLLVTPAVAGGGFGLTNPPYGPYQIATVIGGTGPDHWRPGVAYPVGRYTFADQKVGSPAVWSYFKATSVSGSGTSGGTEPNWNTTPGATTIDNAGGNQITWTCIGPYGAPYWPTPDAAYAGGIVQPVTVAFDTSVNQTLDLPTARYVVFITNAGLFGYPGLIMLHSLQFTFNNITSTSWE